MSEPSRRDYALATTAAAQITAPVLNYRPPQPRNYRPRIALIGAGGISGAHLDAYRKAGYTIAVICNRTLSKAAARRDAFFPSAAISDDIDGVLTRPGVDVVDITTHPAEREAMIDRALRAGKHVLSQKPFVLDLNTGRRLADLADAHGVKLAVNQNGRWAPHFAYMREAIRSGLIGDPITCNMAVHWNHGWIKGTPFEQIDDLIFYDFAIHWFDFLASVIGNRAQSVFATRARAAAQDVAPPLLAQALVQWEGGQGSLIFNAAARFGPMDSTYIAGTMGSTSSIGPNLGEQSVELTTAAGMARPILEGQWFNDGFHGAMGELLCAIEDHREPLNGARGNLSSLALAFAAIASAHRGSPVVPGAVASLAEAMMS